MLAYIKQWFIMLGIEMTVVVVLLSPFWDPQMKWQDLKSALKYSKEKRDLGR